MAAPSIDDLTTPLTTADCKASIYRVLEALGVSTTNWKPGAVVRTIIAAMAMIIAALSQMTAGIAKSGFLDLATGSWLTLVARYVYGVERIDATFASGNSIRAVNAGGGVYSLDPGDLVLSSSATGKQYTNTATVTIGALATVNDIAVQALEQGSESTAFAGEIDTLVTVLPGVTATNLAAVVGFDAEEDAALRTRCRAKLGSLSPNGPGDAYYYVATTAVDADGVSLGVTRVSPPAPDGLGGLDVYVADASGALAGTVGDLSTPLGKVDDDIQRKCVPIPVAARVRTAVPFYVNVTCEVWLYNSLSLSEAAITEAIETELTTWLSTRPIGGDVASTLPGYVYKNTLQAVICRARTPDGVSLGIFRADITMPASDSALAVYHAPVFGALTLTAIHQMPS